VRVIDLQSGKIRLSAPHDLDAAAWHFSTKAETTFPLSSDFCLLFRPGQASYEQTTVGEDTVTYLNLRSAAAAWRNYYGRSKALVESVRRVIETHPEDYERLKSVPGHVYLAHRFDDESTPHQVDVLKPSASIKVSRPRQRSGKRASK
jgi:hypothetical protein